MGKILKLEFDGEVKGNLANKFSFSRNTATVDGIGTSVSANLPRYDRERANGEIVDEPEVVYASTSANINFGAGVDFDGVTPLGCIVLAASNSVVIVKGADGWGSPIYNEVVQHPTNNGFDILQGDEANFRLSPLQPMVIHGCILIYCNRRTVPSGANDNEGIGIVYSNDYGATWTILEDTLGNKTLPSRVVTKNKGTAFCFTNWWPESRGVEAPLGAWITFTDYEFQSATGGQSAICYASRTSVSDPWTIHPARMVFSLESSSGTHFHSSYPIIDYENDRLGVVTAVGDGVDDNRMVLSWMSISTPLDYLTATVNQRDEWHGDKSNAKGGVSAGMGIRGLQFTGVAPGPEMNTALVGSDYNTEILVLVHSPTEDADWSTSKARVSQVLGHTQGDPENFSTKCNNPANPTRWATSMNDISRVIWASNDGRNFIPVWNPSASGTSPHIEFYNNDLIHVVGGVGLRRIPFPKSKVQRPLMLGPGTNNRCGTAWATWTAVGAGNTVTLMNKVGDVYVYPTGHPKAGEPLPEQPQSLGPVYRVQAGGTSNDCGRWYTGAVGAAVGTGSAIGAVLPLVDGTTCDGIVSASDFIPFDTCSTEHWSYEVHRGAINGVSNRATVRPLSRSGSDIIQNDFLITMVGNHADQDISIGYPVNPVTDASAIHELATINDITLASAWSARLSFGTPVLGFIQFPHPLFTIYWDTNNWVKISATADDTVELRVKKAGSETASTVTGMYWRAANSTPAMRDIFGRVVVWCDGTSTKAIITREGIVPGEITVASTANQAATCDIYLASNEAQTRITPLRVFDVILDTSKGSDTYGVEMLQKLSVVKGAAINMVSDVISDIIYGVIK